MNGTWWRRGKYVESFENVLWWLRQPVVGLSNNFTWRPVNCRSYLGIIAWSICAIVLANASPLPAAFFKKICITHLRFWKEISTGKFSVRFDYVNYVRRMTNSWRQFFWGLLNSVFGQGYSHKISRNPVIQKTIRKGSQVALKWPF